MSSPVAPSSPPASASASASASVLVSTPLTGSSAVSSVSTASRSSSRGKKRKERTPEEDLEILEGRRVPDSPEDEPKLAFPPPPQKPLPPRTDAPAVAEWLERPLSDSERQSLIASQTDRGARAKRASGEGEKKRKRSKKNDPLASDLGGADEIKESESKESIEPLPVDDLHEGEERSVPGSKGDLYIVKREGNKIICSCKAWQFQGGKMETRSCKHIQSIRGLAAEIARTGRNITGKDKK